MQNALQKSLWPKSLLCFDITLATAAENLSLDEALLAVVEANPAVACLRFWQPADYFVVLGRSNKPESEVSVGYCVKNGIPIYRRASGGGAVLVGPGCLCYSLALPVAEEHRSMGVSRVTAELMSRTARGLSRHSPAIEVCGTSDLVLDGLKFSGNAQRWLRQSFIHHGTLLFDFNLSLMGRCLPHPTREPSYRSSRRHDEFVTNLSISPVALRGCLRRTWQATPAECPAAVLDAASRISALRYSSADWTISPSP